jgi:hypothetical protein
VSDTPVYIFRWAQYLGLPCLPGRKGELCRVLVRGGRNSCLIEFVRDGFRAVTSRNALRKTK